MTTMDEKTAAKLREHFPADQIGKLPRGGIQLDYVGHADVTSRLLEADPSWNWEPAATDEHGLPLFDTDSNGKPVGLWIKLTAGGVTRLGYGSCPSNQNDAVKVLIGDALRNAAMRFGVALDLWAKGDRADPTAENATASAGHAARRPPRQQSAGGAWENASPAPPKASTNGHAPDEGWVDEAIGLAPIVSDKDAARTLFKLAVSKASEGRITAEQKERICALVTARVAELDAEQKPTDDPWLNEMASMSTREDAGPLLAKLEQARGVTVNETRYTALKAAIRTKADSLPSAPGEAA